MSITEQQAAEMADWLETDLDDDHIVEARPGPGRPPKSTAARKSSQIVVRVTSGDLDRIDDAANRAGMSRSQWLREAVDDHLAS